MLQILELTIPGGINSSLSGSREPVGGRPGPKGGLTGVMGSNLAPGGAPIGGRKPSPPHGPRLPIPSPRPGVKRSEKIGWFGPKNIPSPLAGPANKGPGMKGLGCIGIGSRSCLPIDSGLVPARRASNALGWIYGGISSLDAWGREWGVVRWVEDLRDVNKNQQFFVVSRYSRLGGLWILRVSFFSQSWDQVLNNFKLIGINEILDTVGGYETVHNWSCVGLPYRIRKEWLRSIVLSLNI